MVILPEFPATVLEMRDDKGVRTLPLIAVAVGFASFLAPAQQPAPKPETATPAPVEHHDPTLDLAANLIGRALFLRCFCADDNLTFDAQGHPQGQPKTADWTLAAVNVLKAERKGPGEIQLDGVRVAMRYATDRREFDRHPQNDEKTHFIIADNGDPAAFDRTLKSVFATGIDRPLQLSMPDFWQHFFDPALPWPKDALAGVPVQSIVTPSANEVPAAVTHKAESGYNPIATRDRVAGSVKLHLLVDLEGMPRHIAIVQPLGYGLDEKAVEGAAKYRFTPATVQGKPVVSSVLMNQDFVVVLTPSQ
jgi:hypothetical protein